MTAPARGRLLTCDLICYGAASPAVFQDYLALLERGRGRRLAAYSHRGDGIETRGCEVARFCDGSVERGTARTRLWSRLWYGYLLRESCLSCGHHSLDRPGDLTIGDFWGLERVTRVSDDGWGVSCVLANDAEGLALLQGAAGRLELVESTSLDVANETQPMLSRPPEERPDRDAFSGDAARLGPRPRVQAARAARRAREHERRDPRPQGAPSPGKGHPARRGARRLGGLPQGGTPPPRAKALRAGRAAFPWPSRPGTDPSGCGE